MSRLLQHSEVRHALSLIGVNDPEIDPIYTSLLDLFKKARTYSNSESSDESVYVKNIQCSHVYDTGLNGKRIINFIISKGSEHELSQIFISIMFIKKGLMNHKSTLSFDNKTPIQIIKISENFIQSHEEDEECPF